MYLPTLSYLPFDAAVNAGLGSVFAWGMNGNVKGTALAFVISSIVQTILFLTVKYSLEGKISPKEIFKGVSVIANIGMVCGLLRLNLVPNPAVFLYGSVATFIFFAEFQKLNRKEEAIA